MTNDIELQAGIAETFRAQIPDAETKEQKHELAIMIREAVDAGHLSAEQGDALLKELGVLKEKSPRRKENDIEDRVAWENTLREHYEALRTATLELNELKEKLKEVKKTITGHEAALTQLVGGGSKDFKAKNRTLFDL